jgi:membrane protease subunit (stomatin/prohibitin family)
MGLFEREFIAVPDDRKGQLVFKWPDVSIRRFSRAIVNADQIALFVHTGRVVQTLGPGRHRVDATELPGLGAVVDTLTGANAYRAELYFVGTREFAGMKFGGRLDDVVDPRSEQVVSLRVFGDFAVAVDDPIRFITTLVGTVDLADPARVTTWCADQLLKCMKVAVTREIADGRWPVLGLAAFIPDIESAVLGVANSLLYDYGVRITRMGNFDISVTPDDADRLKQLAKAVKYTELAGGFQQYAVGEMALGAGRGLATGGGATEGGFLAAGLSLTAMHQQLTAQQWAAQPLPHAASPHPVPPQTAPPQTAPTPTPANPGPAADAPLAALPEVENKAESKACGACGTPNPTAARFCMSCGEQLTAAARHCTDCGAPLAAGARFCGACGAKA